MKNMAKKVLVGISLSLGCVILQLWLYSTRVQAEVGTHSSLVRWQPWSDSVFDQAKKDKRLVILYLEAVWCHWCHVIDKETYSNPDVAALISAHFIPLRVDQDSRPDLANRYRDYGWPATIIFDSNGNELAKRAGFIEPEEMKVLLKKLISDPKPESSEDQAPEFATSSTLSEGVRTELERRQYSSFDQKLGGLNTRHRFLDADSVEYSLVRAQEGKKKDLEMLNLTLTANKSLIDPVWGGVYQYSTGSGWTTPHFEKIMSTQTRNIQLYARAYGVTGNINYLEAAQKIRNYLNTFLRDPSGAYYTSQDADVVKGEHSSEYFALSDVERRKIGIPAIDRHMYARENGWVVHALCALYSVKPDPAVLKDALDSANWILANRSLDGGGFSHDNNDTAGPFLGDSLAMGQAMLSLYRVTGNREWLAKSSAAFDFINQNFRVAEEPGVFTVHSKGSVLKPVRLLDENIQAARFANLLFNYTGKPQAKELAENAMRYIGTKSVAFNTIVESGILLADEEISKPALHVTIVGPKSDLTARALFEEALKYPVSYKRLDWYDASEGPLLNSEVQYPDVGKSAAFICTAKRCSLPVFKPEGLVGMIVKVTNQGVTKAVTTKVEPN